MSFSRKSYRLTSDAEKSRVTGKGWQGMEDALCVGGRRWKGEMQPGPGPAKLGHLNTSCSCDQFFTSTHGALGVVVLLTLVAVYGDSTDQELC